MIVEIIAHDVATLYGENGHQILFEQIFSKHTVIKSSLIDIPYFVNHKVDVVYLGELSEKHQLNLIQRLLPHKERIKQMIEEGIYFFVFGNGLNIFGTEIDYEEFGKVCGLNTFSFYTIQRLRPRINNYILGSKGSLMITAHKSQFSQCYPESDFNDFLFTVKDGFGMNRKIREDGVQYKNFYGTNCLGPFLILNPLFLERILKKIDPNLPLPQGFESMVEAYHLRVEEFKSGKYNQISEILL